ARCALGLGHPHAPTATAAATTAELSTTRWWLSAARRLRWRLSPAGRRLSATGRRLSAARRRLSAASVAAPLRRVRLVGELIFDRLGDRVGELGLHPGIGELLALDRMVDEADLDEHRRHRRAEQDVVRILAHPAISIGAAAVA